MAYVWHIAFGFLLQGFKKKSFKNIHLSSWQTQAPLHSEGFCLVSLLVTFFSSLKPPSAIVRFLQNELSLGRPPCSHAKMVPSIEQLKGFKFEMVILVIVS